MENLLVIEKRFQDKAHENFCEKICEIYDLGSFNYEFNADRFNKRKGFIQIHSHRLNNIEIDQHNNLYASFSDLVPCSYVPIYAKIVNEIFSPKVTDAYPNRVFNHVFVRYFLSNNRHRLTLSDIKFLFDNEFKCEDNSFKEWLIGKDNDNFKGFINHYRIEGITRESIIKFIRKNK